MKKLSQVLFASALMFTACNNNNKENTNGNQDSTAVATTQEGAGRMEFEEEAFNFGTIKEGEVVEHVFKFKNTGDFPVVLAQVSASCGCTTPTYTSTPVKPGESGEISVKFDSNGQVGQQQKIITIASNAEKPVTTVQLKGEVVVN
ncbi:DUF1573 domain-containing protein [Sphingobacterium hotanense]|uniref:DUF1573 domain-containing protein n=1 Tax=Sphingobacterium hotanense TaxID=649196 RepID=UPI0021A2BF18|nr:DUF1573 domain-containing protein [Sphingobacterium hotanense]MCT1526725.1 DUF1573 domain-containing protein [Sphingobacterium hotanense]